MMEKCKYDLLVEKLVNNLGTDKICVSVRPDCIIVDRTDKLECVVIVGTMYGALYVSHGNNYITKITDQDLIDFNILPPMNDCVNAELDDKNNYDIIIAVTEEMFSRGNTSHLVVADDLCYKEFTKHEHTVMELVDILANKSTCQRAKMGSVIVIDDGIFITGYNGTLKSFPNNCDDISLVCTVCNIVVDPSDYNEGDQHCKKGYIEKRPKSNTNVVHAEVNSIYKAAKYGICIKDRPMYMTTSPCVNCANAIVQAGISKVVYKYDHDDLRGLDTLRKAGIEVIKYKNK